MRYAIDADIAQASTLPGAFYGDAGAFERARERVFARSWQWLGDTGDVEAAGSVSPRTLLPGLIDEPLVLARDGASTLRCLSNVCTHRANLIVAASCRASELRCAYHSRRFDLAGRMTFMPGFEGARGFPSPSDDLPQVALATWGGLAFAALDPPGAFADVAGSLLARLPATPDATWRHDPARDRDFAVDAHWALYVENYLEGFHIPFAHPALAMTIDARAYRDELHAGGTLQIAPAKAGEPAFAAPDGGERIAAYYAWLFPNVMLNLYPWGLSLNVVLPQSLDRTRVLFRSYVRDPALLGSGAGSALDLVEAEDEAIVHAVQRGVRARLYGRGRYSPAHERGVHHFHRMLCARLDGA